VVPYSAPLDKLLTLGEPRFGQSWKDYSLLGLTSEHVPELIRMATDPALNKSDSASKEVWAPTHAWRALGQLHALAALEPLLAMLDSELGEDDDWVLDDFPRVFALFGPEAIPRLGAYLAEERHRSLSRQIAAGGLADMSKEYLETREQCLAILAQQLEASTRNSRELNAFLISDLIDLEAVAAAPAIERAFAAGLVDETICGDWEHVQYELGLSDEPPEHFDEPFAPVPLAPAVPGFFSVRAPRDAKDRAKAKARRKAAANSRRRNRPKKRR
jgi:hypothetical protein